MSVARRAGSGAASARVQYATRRRWARWAGLLRPRGGAGLLRLALTATTPSLLDPSLPALPSCRSPPRRGPRRSRSRSTFRTSTSVRLPRLAVGTEPLAYFLKFHFQRENAKPDRHSQCDGRKLKPNGSLLSRTLNTLTLCRVPATGENLLARVRQGSRLGGPFHWPQPTCF